MCVGICNEVIYAPIIIGARLMVGMYSPTSVGK
jgi:hypothetical protein